MCKETTVSWYDWSEKLPLPHGGLWSKRALGSIAGFVIYLLATWPWSGHSTFQSLLKLWMKLRYHFHSHGFAPDCGSSLCRNWETCWCFTWKHGWLYLLPRSSHNSGNRVDEPGPADGWYSKLWKLSRNHCLQTAPCTKIGGRACSWTWHQGTRNIVPDLRRWNSLRSFWRLVHGVPGLLTSCCISTVRNITRTDLLLLLKFKRSKYPYISAFFFPFAWWIVVWLFWCNCECCCSKEMNSLFVQWQKPKTKKPLNLLCLDSNI